MAANTNYTVKASEALQAAVQGATARGNRGMSYDPARHHRRSIRLKGHDYAGGGVYFVTLCAHREFVAWARGNPFGALGATGAPCRSGSSWPS